MITKIVMGELISYACWRGYERSNFIHQRYGDENNPKSNYIMVQSQFCKKYGHIEAYCWDKIKQQEKIDKGPLRRYIYIYIYNFFNRKNNII